MQARVELQPYQQGIISEMQYEITELIFQKHVQDTPLVRFERLGGVPPEGVGGPCGLMI